MAAVLIDAALAKLTRPGPVALAVAELAGSRSSLLTPWRVRAFAVAELTAGSALLVASVRVPAAAAVATLGVLFAVAGLIGHLRGASVPCGCIGVASDAPLGLRNVLTGLALALVLPLDVVADGSGSAVPAAAGPALAAPLMLLLCLWFNRALAISALRTAPHRPKLNGAR